MRSTAQLKAQRKVHVTMKAAGLVLADFIQKLEPFPDYAKIRVIKAAAMILGITKNNRTKSLTQPPP